MGYNKKPIAVILDNEIQVHKRIKIMLSYFNFNELIRIESFEYEDDAILFVIENYHDIFLIIHDTCRTESKIIKAWKKSNPKINVASNLYKFEPPRDFYNYIIDSYIPHAICIYHSAYTYLDNLFNEWANKDKRMIPLTKPASVSEFNEAFNQAFDVWNKTFKGISEENRILAPVSEELISICGYKPDYLNNLTSRQFEEVINSIFKNNGFYTELTAKTRDGGYDIMALSNASLKNEITIIEVKHFAPNRSVGVGVIRELYGVKKLLNADKALLVTSSYVSAYAKKEFQRTIPLELDIVERKKVIDWCTKYFHHLLA
ncbi:restriction endonuclease [Flavivirga aquimarina]|uniref:Restriction endonuclease n=1 Tax=Flavivirga aquimarina TaxID=2027862 RepID=A0ABT8WDB0_9FLAO|nr:restriction endonuclease [Flavivirga aquimarina]MDO5971047.1 restriction endonuclease [Flavivirga aquimarina]